MDARTLAIAGLGTVALLAIVALPALVAWFLAHQSGMPRLMRRSFMFTCTLLVFGFLGLTGGLLLPLEVVATWVAPELSVRGHATIATAIYNVSFYGNNLACFLVSVVALVFVPLRLRHVWPTIVLAVGEHKAARRRGKPGAATRLD
jgi:hypothetical protein